MIELGEDPEPTARELAAYVLGQLGWQERAFPQEQAAALTAMAEREQDTGVVAAIAYAFGHLGERLRPGLGARPARAPGRRGARGRRVRARRPPR